MDDGLERLNVSRKTETMGSQRNNVQQLSKTDNQKRWPQSSAVERTFRRSSGGNARSSMHARKLKRSATGLRVPRVETSVTPEQLRDLMKKTDLKRLTNRMEELAEPAGASASPSQMPKRNLQGRRPHDRFKQRIAIKARLSICILPSCARDRTALVVAKQRSDS